MAMEYEAVIGLEVHVQLSTHSKIFCGSSTRFGAEPNAHVDPITLGLPGSLPVLNRRVVEYAIMLGLALNCEIRSFNRFARKHYIYPDLPKGYQISQFEEPICERGSLNIRVDDTARTIGITRIHMEEDAGKNIHNPRTKSSLIDLNRAGVPLLEVVSEPDLRSPAETVAYLRNLRQIVRFLGISDGNMEEGSLRCDANISMKPVGETKLGTRTEIKNLNSFRFAEKALEYEIARQLRNLKIGKEIKQQTLLYDSVSDTTQPMRGKEESADYRYFPDPDLPPLVIEERWIANIQSKIPKLPEAHLERLVQIHGLSAYDAEVLTAEPAYVEYFDEVFNTCSNAKAACNWISTELFGRLNKEQIDISQSPISARNLGELLLLVESETISGKMAKKVFEEMFQTGATARSIVEDKGLKQITDPEEIRKIVRQVFEQNSEQLQQLLDGKETLFGFFVGRVMKTTQGSANPKVVNQVLEEELGNRKGPQDD